MMSGTNWSSPMDILIPASTSDAHNLLHVVDASVGHMLASKCWDWYQSPLRVHLLVELCLQPLGVKTP